MPVPHDIHQRVIVSRFRRRQATVLGIVIAAFAFAAYHASVIYSAPVGLPSPLTSTDRITLSAMALLGALLVGYVTYRCPNCNNRPLGKAWPGFYPSKCRSCKIGLRH